MQRQQQMVREFLVKHLGAQPDGWPTSTGIFNKWLLIREEYHELTDALGVRDDPVAHAWIEASAFDEVKTVDAICDLLYVIFNLCEELHINIEPFFNEVHRSNMTKTPGALSPTKKILKGPDFQPPRIAEMLAAHRENGYRKVQGRAMYPPFQCVAPTHVPNPDTYCDERAEWLVWYTSTGGLYTYLCDNHFKHVLTYQDIEQVTQAERIGF